MMQMYYDAIHPISKDEFADFQIVFSILESQVDFDDCETFMGYDLKHYVRRYLRSYHSSPEFLNNLPDEMNERTYASKKEQAISSLKSFFENRGTPASSNLHSLPSEVDSSKQHILVTSIYKLNCGMYIEVVADSERVYDLLEIYSSQVYQYLKQKNYFNTGKRTWSFSIPDIKNAMCKVIDASTLPEYYQATAKVIKKKNVLTCYMQLNKENEIVDSFYVQYVESNVTREHIFAYALCMLAVRNKGKVNNIRVRSNCELTDTDDVLINYNRIIRTIFSVLRVEVQPSISILKSKIKERVSYLSRSRNTQVSICNVESNFGKTIITLHSIIRFIERSLRWLDRYPFEPYAELEDLIKNYNWREATREERIENSLPLNESTIYISDETVFALACEYNFALDCHYLTTILCKGNENTAICDLVDTFGDT